MIDEHVQESAVEGSRAILAWSQGSPLRYAQRSTVATRWRTAALCSRRPIRSGVCVCVSRLKSSVSFTISQKDSCVSAGDGGIWRPRSETARDTEKRKANDGFDNLAIIAGIIYSNLRSRT
jgi:hypothetical protein